MRKFLSLTLALVMVLGTFSGVFAATTEEQNEAARFLDKEKILLGDEKGNLLLNENLERRDSVVLLSRLLGVEVTAKGFPTSAQSPSWTDVRTDPYYVPFFAWAESNGYFEGNDDKTFRPREDLSAQEYALVLLRALEYDVKGHESWKDALNNAKRVGLLENLDLKDGDKVLRGDMAVMTLNALGTTLNGKDETLAKKLGIELPAPKELKVEEVRSENLKEVVVELSNAKLADAEKLADKDNYRVDGKAAHRVTVNGNNVIVEVRNPLTKGTSYELVIRNIEREINGKYNFTARDNTSPKVEKVEALGEYGIKVVTSEPVERVRERDFLIDGRNVTMELEVYGRNIILRPYTGSFPSNAKKLTVERLEDYSGYTSAREEFDLDIKTDRDAPKVTDVVIKGDKVEVTFDKDIYEPSVKAYENRRDVGNVSYVSGRHTIYADKATKVDTNKAEYVFEDDTIRRRTEVTVEGVQNHSKVAMERVNVEAREVLDYSEPEIIKTSVDTAIEDGKGTATIKLTFDKEVSGIFERPVDYFTLYKGGVRAGNDLGAANVKSVKHDGDKKDVIVVELVDLEEYDQEVGNDYTLEIRNFTDMSSLRNRMYRDYVDFEVKKETAFRVENISRRAGRNRNMTEIVIAFSERVDKVEAEKAGNYLFTHNNGTLRNLDGLRGEVYIEGRGKVVVLELPDFNADNYNQLEILRTLKDEDGNRLANNVVYKFNDSNDDDEKEEEVNKAAAKKVEDEINKLPEVVELTHKSAVEAARKAYNDLSAAQKELVPQAAKDKLAAAEAKIKELEDQNVGVTAKFETAQNPISGKYLLRVELSDKTKKVEKFIVAGTDVPSVEDAAKNLFIADADFDTDPTDVKVVVDGKEIVATKK